MNKKSLIKNSILVVVLLMVVVGVVILSNDYDKLILSFKKIKIEYFVFSALATVLYWVTWALSLVLIVKKYPSELANADFFLISSSDLFFNGITPLSSGGQPFQIYAFNRGKMKISDSTSGIVGKMIVYQIAIIIYTLGALLIAFNRINDNTSGFIYLIIGGIVINIFVLLLIFIVSMTKNGKDFSLKVFDLIGKIKPLKKYFSKKRSGFEKYLMDFQVAFKNLLKDRKCLIYSVLMQLLSMFFQFVISYFLLKSFVADVSITYIISISALNSAFSSFFPTPGASGGAEFGLQVLLMTVGGVDVTIASLVMLLTRFFTYYLSMLYGAICYLIVDKRLRKKELVVKKPEVIYWGNNL